MIELRANANFTGAEGWVSRGDKFTVATEQRARQLEAEGRAVRVYPEGMGQVQAAKESVEAGTEQTKGQDTSPAVETKTVQAPKNKRGPGRPRKTQG